MATKRRIRYGLATSANPNIATNLGSIFTDDAKNDVMQHLITRMSDCHANHDDLQGLQNMRSVNKLTRIALQPMKNAETGKFKEFKRNNRNFTLEATPVVIAWVKFMLSLTTTSKYRDHEVYPGEDISLDYTELFEALENLAYGLKRFAVKFDLLGIVMQNLTKYLADISTELFRINPDARREVMGNIIQTQGPLILNAVLGALSSLQSQAEHPTEVQNGILLIDAILQYMNPVLFSESLDDNETYFVEFFKNSALNRDLVQTLFWYDLTTDNYSHLPFITECIYKKTPGMGEGICVFECRDSQGIETSALNLLLRAMRGTAPAAVVVALVDEILEFLNPANFSEVAVDRKAYYSKFFENSALNGNFVQTLFQRDMSRKEYSHLQFIVECIERETPGIGNALREDKYTDTQGIETSAIDLLLGVLHDIAPADAVHWYGTYYDRVSGACKVLYHLVMTSPVSNHNRTAKRKLLHMLCILLCQGKRRGVRSEQIHWVWKMIGSICFQISESDAHYMNLFFHYMSDAGKLPHNDRLAPEVTGNDGMQHDDAQVNDVQKEDLVSEELQTTVEAMLGTHIGMGLLFLEVSACEAEHCICMVQLNILWVLAHDPGCLALMLAKNIFMLLDVCFNNAKKSFIRDALVRRLGQNNTNALYHRLLELQEHIIKLMQASVRTRCQN